MTTEEDEVRFGKITLLLLNTCPIYLRPAVDHHNTNRDFETFVTVNKHPLFHRIKDFQDCCDGTNCIHKTRNKHLFRKQWDKLYIPQPTSVCPRNVRGDCPCKFEAKAGITSGVMDITLCCFILTFIGGQKRFVRYVHKIRDIRNEMIHIDNGYLDAQQFNDYWTDIEQSLRNIASTVSQTLRNEVTNALRTLKDRLIDPVELETLRTIMLQLGKQDDIWKVSGCI